MGSLIGFHQSVPRVEQTQNSTDPSSDHLNHNILKTPGSHDTLCTPYPPDDQEPRHCPIQTPGADIDNLEREAFPDIQLISSAQSSSGKSPGSFRDEKGRNPFCRVSTELTAATPPSTKGTGSWAMELFSIFVAIGAVASVIGLLARYNGKALPTWPYDITLNALIAVLTTIANTAMSVVLSSGMGQLKWDRARRGYVPLMEMELLDEASRGAWGALKLLQRLGGGVTGSFGAIAVLGAWLVSPFAQQIATFPIQVKESGMGAVNYRAMNFTMALPSVDSAEPFVPVLPVKSAVYNGLFAENNRPSSSLDTNCQTGNCTWEKFDTLAVCSSCVDMTQYMDDSCSAGANDCGWELPTGAVLHSSDVFSMTTQFPSTYGAAPWSTIMRLTFMGTESNTGKAGNVEPWARQCTLSACVQTIASEIVNGELTENITSTVTNQTVMTSNGASTALTPVVIMTDASSYNTSSASAAYTLSAEAMLSLQSWFAQIFSNGSATRTESAVNTTLTSAADAAVAVNLTVGISSGATFFDTDIVQAFYWNYYEYPSGLDMLVQDTSVSLTVAFRSLSGAEAVNGVALMSVPFVHVQWGYATPLILAIVLTAAFLAQAVYSSRGGRTQLWKSSALAMLLHGLDGDTRGGMSEPGAWPARRDAVRKVRVRLDESTGGGLLETEVIDSSCPFSA